MARQSQMYSSDSGQVPFAIGEPRSALSESRRAGSYGESGSTYGIEAKEPDRQTASRRGTRSSRGRGRMESDEGEQTRGQGARRSNARGGAQARRAAERGAPARRTSGPETKGRKKSRRGFAAMSPEQQREIARKGGLTVSRNRRHMAEIGRIGGEHSHGGRRGRR
ncbi:MAG: KGG domain-containing protein [Verrucomicrobiia bacterium]